MGKFFVVQPFIKASGYTFAAIPPSSFFMASLDSRKAAYRIYKKLKLDWVFNTSSFLGNLLVAVAAAFLFRKLGYGPEADFVFLLTVLSIGLWVTEAVPPFAVGIFIVIMLVFAFGSDFLFETNISVGKYINTWTSNVIWLLLGGFFLAQGMKEAELDRALFQFTLKHFGQQPEKLLMGLMLVTALASMVMSNTATTAMMISSIMPLIRQKGEASPFTKALLIGIPAAASVGGMGTIIGSTPNAIVVGALQEKGVYISFVDWMLLGFPTGLLLVFLFYRYLVFRLNIREVALDIDTLSVAGPPVDRFKRNAVLVTLIVTVGLWVTEPFHQIPVAATSAVPILFLTMTQVIESEQVRQLPWDTLMLVAGGLALGLALVDVGLAAVFMGSVQNWPLPVWLVSLFFSIAALLLSNVMSNTAAASILIPLSTALPGIFGVATPVIVALVCSCALLLPVSTPANAIAFATGLVEQRTFRLGGVFFLVLGPITVFLAVLIWAYTYIL
jgi:sodium-dependent dicarboxylate transporter 2/3/5